MKLKMFASAAVGLAAALTLSAPAQAATRVLDFTGACGGAAFCTIGQGFGDDATVNISYRTVDGTTGDTLDGLNFASAGYGDLDGAVFGADGEDAYAEIMFEAANGFELSLRSFDFAGLAARTRATFELYSRDGDLLGAIGYRTPAGHGTAAFDDNYLGAVIMRWKPSADVAVDNITFDTRALPSAVPEPASWALMIAGFGLVGGAMRRRREALATA